MQLCMILVWRIIAGRVILERVVVGRVKGNNICNGLHNIVNHFNCFNGNKNKGLKFNILKCGKFTDLIL